MLAQPVWANCDLTEEEGHCEVGEAGFVAFTTGTGRSLSEAYCNALGQLRPLGVASDLSSTLTEYDDGTKTDLNSKCRRFTDTYDTIKQQIISIAK